VSTGAATGGGGGTGAGTGTVTEHALLPVVAGREDEFIETIERAKSIIAASPGFLSLRVERCIERPNYFLLLVEWETLEDHTSGFRGSAAYEEWRALLHHFYDPFPVVEHFEVVTTA
jgi:heme-degrading monooxygenase HmoA